MKDSLDTFRQEIKATGQTHATLAQKMHAELEKPTITFFQKQMETRKNSAGTVEQQLKTKSALLAEFNRLREKVESERINQLAGRPPTSNTATGNPLRRFFIIYNIM